MGITEHDDDEELVDDDVLVVVIVSAVVVLVLVDVVELSLPPHPLKASCAMPKPAINLNACLRLAC